MPIRAGGNVHRVVVVVRARVTKGEIGFGLLAPDGKTLVEQRQGTSRQPVQIVLPVGGASQASQLIVRNTMPGGTSSEVAIDGVETWQLD
jgi:hypothetical protein